MKKSEILVKEIQSLNYKLLDAIRDAIDEKNIEGKDITFNEPIMHIYWDDNSSSVISGLCDRRSLTIVVDDGVNQLHEPISILTLYQLNEILNIIENEFFVINED